MGEVLEFRRPQKNKTKSCQDCRFLTNRRSNPIFWTCGVSGGYCEIEIGSPLPQRCGKEKVYWEQRPPSFWQRLGNAMIKKIEGNRN